MELRSALQTSAQESKAASPPANTSPKDRSPAFAVETPSFVAESSPGAEPPSFVAESGPATEPISLSVLAESSHGAELGEYSMQQSSLVIAEAPLAGITPETPSACFAEMKSGQEVKDSDAPREHVKAPEVVGEDPRRAAEQREDPSGLEEQDSDPSFTGSTAATAQASLPDSLPESLGGMLDVKFVENSSEPLPPPGQLHDGSEEAWQHLRDQLQSLHRSVNDFALKQPDASVLDASQVLTQPLVHSQPWTQSSSSKGPNCPPAAVHAAPGAKAAAQLSEDESSKTSSCTNAEMPNCTGLMQPFVALHTSQTQVAVTLSVPSSLSSAAPGLTPSSTSRDSAPSYKSCLTQASYPATQTVSYQPSQNYTPEAAYPSARELRSQALPFAMHSFDRTDAMARLRRALGSEQKRSSSQPHQDTSRTKKTAPLQSRQPFDFSRPADVALSRKH